MATPTQQAKFDFESKPLEERISFWISSFMLSTEARDAVISDLIEKMDVKELYKLMDDLVEQFNVEDVTKRQSVAQSVAQALHIKTKTEWDIMKSICQCFLALLMKEDQRSTETTEKLTESMKKLVKKSKAETIPVVYKDYMTAHAKLRQLFKNGQPIQGRKMYAAQVAVAWQKMFTDKDLSTSSMIIVHQVMCLDLTWDMVCLAQENPTEEKLPFVALAPPPEEKVDPTADNIFVMINFSAFASHYMLPSDKMCDTINVNWESEAKITGYLKEKVDPFKKMVEHLKDTTQREAMSTFKGLMEAMVVLFVSWQVKMIPEKLKLLKGNHVYDSCLEPAYAKIKELSPAAWADFSPKAGALKEQIAGFLAHGQIDNATTALVDATEALAQAWEAWTETTPVDTYYDMLLWQCAIAILLFVIFDVASQLAAQNYAVLGTVSVILGEHLPTDDGADAEGATGQQ